MALLHSASPQMTDPLELEGATLRGARYVFAHLDGPVAGVTWLIDGIAYRDNDVLPPYTLVPNAGQLAGGFDFNELTEGEHAICILVEDTAGRTTFEGAGFTVEHVDEEPTPTPSGRGPGKGVRAPFTPLYPTPAVHRAATLAELNAALARAGPGEVIEVEASIPGSGPGGATLTQQGGTEAQNVLVRPRLGQRLSFTPTFGPGASYITVAGFSASCWLKPGPGGMVRRSGLWRATGNTGFMGFYGRTEDCFLVEPVVKTKQVGSDPIQVKGDVGDVVRPLIAYGWLAGGVREGISHTDVVQFVGYSGFGQRDATIRGCVLGPSASGVIQQANMKGLFTIDDCWVGSAEGKSIQGGSALAGNNASVLLRRLDVQGSANFPNNTGVPWGVVGVVECNASGAITINGVARLTGVRVPSMPALPASPWGSEVPL